MKTGAQLSRTSLIWLARIARGPIRLPSRRYDALDRLRRRGTVERRVDPVSGAVRLGLAAAARVTA